MAKTHYKIAGVDHRGRGQTEFEYAHQTACGYVRDNVSVNGDDVDCETCLESIHMVHYHAINRTNCD